MEDWKPRVVDEYKQLHGRYERLSAMIAKYEAGTLTFTPNCPLCLLRMQADAMRKYLDILEIRGKIEKINLPLCILRMQADTMRKYLDILEIRGKIEKINLAD